MPDRWHLQEKKYSSWIEPLIFAPVSQLDNFYDCTTVITNTILLFIVETSSRNSEVIHAGLYYPANSLKAQFCVQGKQQLYQFCDQRNIPYRPCGKLIVATNPQQLSRELPKLKQQAFENGVDDIQLLTKQDVQ